MRLAEQSVDKLEKALGPWVKVEIAHNSVLAWSLAFASALLASLASRTLQSFIVRRIRRASERTKTGVDDVLVSVLGATKVTFHLSIGLLAGRPFLTLPAAPNAVLIGAITILIGIQCGVWAQTAIGGSISVWARGKVGGEDATLASGLRFLSRLVVWTLVLLVVLSNLGVELSAVIAGLGIGGVAAALAVQSLLGDLIAGISMYFDRPFNIGDFVIVGNFMGSVRKIGMRTTRLAALDGEEIIMPNGDLVKANIRNYARMQERRVVFGFGVEYRVSADKVERARQIATEAIQKRSGVRLDRVHFKTYGGSSLEFEAVYYVLSPDYNVYMDHQHSINMELYRRFEEEGIPFAMASHTIYLRPEATNSLPKDKDPLAANTRKFSEQAQVPSESALCPRTHEPNPRAEPRVDAHE